MKTVVLFREKVRKRLALTLTLAAANRTCLTCLTACPPTHLAACLVVCQTGRQADPEPLAPGVFWAQAGAEFQEFTEMAGIPFYTMPQTRGIIPEDHPLCFSELGAKPTQKRMSCWL